MGVVAHGTRLRRGRRAIHAGVELQRVELTRPGRVQERGLFGGERGGRRARGTEGDIAANVRTGGATGSNIRHILRREQTIAVGRDIEQQRGAALLLNVPPNRDGLLPAEDVANVRTGGATGSNIRGYISFSATCTPTSTLASEEATLLNPPWSGQFNTLQFNAGVYCAPTTP